MEAEKLKKKKGTINKGKVKKSLKNVICRPDPLFWPAVTEDEENVIETVLKKHKVCIPVFKKLHWKELKTIPKKDRPKQPSIPQVDGLLFGISACQNAIQKNNCLSVIIDALVEPQTLVQIILEGCSSANIPVICVKNLRSMTKNYFGIQTSCLGIQKGRLLDLSETIKEISHKYKAKLNNNLHKEENIVSETDNKVDDESQNTEANNSNGVNINIETSMDLETTQSNDAYLYRTNKKTRMFVPNSQEIKDNKQFSGQQFIKISENIKKVNDRKAYMNMILKKMSSNANRVKKPIKINS